MGNRWRKDIGTATSSGQGDINQARADVSQDGGQSGVPWVNTSSSMASMRGDSDAFYAGGVNQPPIHVIHDTALKGYQVIVSDSASMRDHRLKDSSSELETVWSTARAAADWITDAVGDEIITTYDGGQKSSQPGSGLYADIENQTQQLEPQLQALVTAETPLTVENLQAVSPEGMALSPEMIHSIQNQPQVTQAIIVDKLSQNLAAMTVINQARLAIEVLQAGAKIPAIYSNKAAQRTIQNAIQFLQQEVGDMLMFVKARETLMSNMLSTVIEAGESQLQKNTAVSMPKTNAPILEQGAIKAEY